jgi:hypothetical protein
MNQILIGAALSGTVRPGLPDTLRDPDHRQILRIPEVKVADYVDSPGIGRPDPENEAVAALPDRPMAAKISIRPGTRTVVKRFKEGTDIFCHHQLTLSGMVQGRISARTVTRMPHA